MTVTLAGCAYPLTIAWRDAGGIPPLTLEAGGSRSLLEGSGSLTLTNPADRIALESTPASQVPERFALYQNYPNPFNPSTEIRYDVPADAPVRLIVYTLLGEEVARLVDERQSAGQQSIRWDAGDQPSGVYLVRVVSGASTATIKMLLMR